MSNQPLDKGRVSFIAEKYQNNNGEQKNRYATVGRATKWPSQNGMGENVEIELDSVPIGHTGSLKLFIFWDSERDNQQQQTGGFQQQQNYQGQPQQSQHGFTPR